jgi:DNA-directed RNA polymerase subunit RPC12/RpoP
MDVLTFAFIIVLVIIVLVIYSKIEEQENKCPKCGFQLEKRNIGIDELSTSLNVSSKIVYNYELKCPNCKYSYIIKVETKNRI